MDFEMWQGGWGWTHASPASLRAWGHDPCVVAGLCGHPGSMGHIVGACKVSPCGYGGWGVYIWVAQQVRHGLLRETARITSRSCDWFGFCEGDAVRTGGGYGGVRGHVRACGESVGGRTTHEEACIGYRGACSPMLGGEVGALIQERAGLVLVSN